MIALYIFSYLVVILLLCIIIPHLEYFIDGDWEFWQILFIIFCWPLGLPLVGLYELYKVWIDIKGRLGLW